MKRIFDLLLWLWQAPQNLLGLAFWLYWRKDIAVVCHDRGRRFCIVPTFPSGISLGDTIIVKYGFLQDEKGWNHEFGHSLQSVILGPFYLLIIGLPSLLWAWWWRPGRGVDYYAFFTEKWADRLGGVKR
jgi:hypothetical protein